MSQSNGDDARDCEAIVREAIATLAAGRGLSRQQARDVMEATMLGCITDAQLGAVMMGLIARGESVDEIAGMALAMRDHAVPVDLGDTRLLDTCGTGGDGSSSFNVSTVAAFVCCGAGAVVAKHGNRAMSSSCGSADVLEALGAAIDLDARSVIETIERTSFGFMFAPRFHPAMRHAVGPRRELGIRTVFNVLGPLANPARARHHVLGVADDRLAPLMAQVLAALDVEHALVLHGHDGFDEMSIGGPTTVYDVRGGRVTRSVFDATSVGIDRVGHDALVGGDRDHNARIARSILAGEDGPRRDVVLLNAAAGLLAGDLVGSIAEGVALARRSIDSGAAAQRLDEFVSVSAGCAQADA